MKPVIAALSVLAMGAGPVLALEGPGRELRASDTVLQLSSDAVLTSAAPGDAVQRSFIPPYSGVVRVKWEFSSGDGTEVFGSAKVTHLSSCERLTVSTAFVAKACNIRVAAGVPITISSEPDHVGNTASLRNVRLYYKVVDSDGLSIIYEAPTGR
jgi:hypothetical protein